MSTSYPTDAHNQLTNPYNVEVESGGATGITDDEERRRAWEFEREILISRREEPDEIVLHDICTRLKKPFIVKRPTQRLVEISRKLLLSAEDDYESKGRMYQELIDKYTEPANDDKFSNRQKREQTALARHDFWTAALTVGGMAPHSSWQIYNDEEQRVIQKWGNHIPHKSTHPEEYQKRREELNVWGLTDTRMERALTGAGFISEAFRAFQDQDSSFPFTLTARGRLPPYLTEEGIKGFVSGTTAYIAERRAELARRFHQIENQISVDKVKELIDTSPWAKKGISLIEHIADTDYTETVEAPTMYIDGSRHAFLDIEERYKAMDEDERKAMLSSYLKAALNSPNTSSHALEDQVTTDWRAWARFGIVALLSRGESMIWEPKFKSALQNRSTRGLQDGDMTGDLGVGKNESKGRSGAKSVKTRRREKLRSRRARVTTFLNAEAVQARNILWQTSVLLRDPEKAEQLGLGEQTASITGLGSENWWADGKKVAAMLDGTAWWQPEEPVTSLALGKSQVGQHGEYTVDEDRDTMMSDSSVNGMIVPAIIVD